MDQTKIKFDMLLDNLALLEKQGFAVSTSIEPIKQQRQEFMSERDNFLEKVAQLSYLLTQKAQTIA